MKYKTADGEREFKHPGALKGAAAGIRIIDSQGRIWANQHEAARVLGIKQPSINMVLRGRRDTAGGLTFRYLAQPRVEPNPAASEVYRKKERARIRDYWERREAQEKSGPPASGLNDAGPRPPCTII